jgi:hypothetical protein
VAKIEDKIVLSPFSWTDCVRFSCEKITEYTWLSADLVRDCEIQKDGTNVRISVSLSIRVKVFDGRI